MIVTKNLGFKVKNKKLLSNACLTFEPNEITMIIGPNGAGKSTLIKLLSHELKCATGEVLFNDKNIDRIGKANLAKIRGVLSQNLELSFPLSVEQVVMMGRYPHFENKPSAEDKRICKEAILFFNVEKLLDRNYQSLSGGEKQRVHFARVAAQIWPDQNKETKFLLLDEPLTYLDVYYQYEFMRLIKKLMKLQKMVLVGVVHDLNLAYQFADKVILLNEGKVLAQGHKKTVFSTANITKSFNIEHCILKDKNGDEFLVIKNGKTA